MKYFIGLDVHWRQVTVCIRDHEGKVFRRLTIRGGWQRVVDELAQLDRPCEVCYEASCGYGHLYDLLKPIAARIVVAHPQQVRLIFRSKRKNDRVDAEKLALLLYLNQVPAVHVPSADVRSWRQLIEYRGTLIAKRTRAKNSCRALLRSLGIQAPRQPGLWSQAGMAWLRGLHLPMLYAVRRDLLCEELELLTRQLRRTEQALAQFSENHSRVALLRTIPGVGLRTAEAVVAYLDDPHRFTHNKAVGSYLGLVPCQDQSAGVNRLGHITRQGPGSVRRLLVEASWQGIRHSPTIAAYFHGRYRGDKQRLKTALVATAHYLARVMHAMLRTGELWQERITA